MNRFIAALLSVLVIWAPTQASAGKITKGIAVGVGALAIRKGGKVVLQKSIQRLTPELGRIARACISKQFGPELKSAVTDKVISALVDAYLGEMVTDYGAPAHTREERQYAQSEFVDKKYEKLSPSDNARARAQYDAHGQREKMMTEWSSRRDDSQWPKSARGVGPNGEILPSKPAQLHHNKPISLGGSPTNSMNATPLFPNGHQKGVHKGGGMLTALVNCMKARGS